MRYQDIVSAARSRAIKEMENKRQLDCAILKNEVIFRDLYFETFLKELVSELNLNHKDYIESNRKEKRLLQLSNIVMPIISVRSSFALMNDINDLLDRRCTRIRFFLNPPFSEGEDGLLVYKCIKQVIKECQPRINRLANKEIIETRKLQGNNIKTDGNASFSLFGLLKKVFSRENLDKKTISLGK